MKRILIVDDSPLILAQLTDILTSLGYETVGSAASGTEAIHLARALSPDAILMDIVMPGEPDGIDAARLINRELDIPTIFLTGSRNVAVLDKIKDTGAYGYIEKPFSSSEIGAAIEIALQKRQSVRKITDLYENLVENTSDFVYVLDGKGQIKFLNRAVCRALGEPLDRLRGRNFRDLVTPESYKHAEKIFAKQLAAEQFDTFELELYDAQKNVRIIEIRERLIWENGRVVEIHGIGRDVTDLKRREEFYRKREERYRVITENMKDTVWVLDRNLKPVFASPSVERARGYTLEEIKALPLDKNVTPASYDAIVKSIVGMLNKAKAGAQDEVLTDVLDLEWIRKDGTTYWAEVSLTVIADEKGNPDEILGVGRDITDRIVKDKMLRESEERYRALFEHAAFGIFHSLAEGKFIRVNPAVARILGYDSPDEVISSIKDFQTDLYVHPEDRQKAIEAIADQEGWGFFEAPWRRKDGSIIIAKVHIRLVFGQDGEFQYVEGILEDVTEERNAQQQILYLKEFNEAIINNMVDSIDIIDKDYTIVFQNSTAKRKFGEGVGRRCHDFYHGRDNPCDYCMAPESLASRRCGSREVEMEDGTWLEVHSSPIKMPDGTLCSMEIMRDITERKRAEKALKASEEKHRTILHTIEDGYFEVDLKGSFTSWNDAMRTMLGYDPEEMVGLNYRQYMDKEIADNVFLTFNEIFRTGAPAKTMDWRLNRKDGTKIDIETSISPARDTSGKPTGFFGISRDITVRKRAETALKESEQRFRLLAENANDCIFTIDLNLRPTYVSPSIIRLRGFTLEEVMTHTLADVITPASFEIAMDAFRREFETEVSGTGDPNRMIRMEMDVTRKDSPPLLMETTLSFLRDSQGNPIGVLGIARDISERKKAEEALRESEQRYRLLAENANDTIFTTDMDLRFTYVSPSATRLLGFTPEEAMDMGVGKLLTPASMDLAGNTLREELEIEASGTGDPARMRFLELEEYRKDGSTVWTETTLSFLRDTNGKPAGILGITRDISERRRAQEAIRDSERLYRLLAENVNDVIFVMDMNLAFTYVSPSVTRLRGFSVQETLSQTVSDVLVKDSLALSLDTFAKELKEDARTSADLTRTTTLELEIYCKDGSTVWTETTFSPLRDEKGTPTAIIGVVRDITERRKAEELIRESEQRYRLLAENANDAIFTTDMNLQPTYVSPSMVRMRGFSAEETLTQNIAETLTPASLELAISTFKKELEIEAKGDSDPNRSIRLELEAFRKDGSTVWGETTLSFLRDSQGNSIGILGITRDISERRKAEEALRLSEEKFRNVFETSRDLLYIATIDGKMLECSKSALEILGYSEDELLQMNLQDHYAYPEEREIFVRKVLDEGFVENYEQKLKKKNGTLIDCLVTAAIRRDAGDAVIGLQGAVKDITRMKRLEQQLLQSEKLSGLGTMISGVAHELNNPLTVIMGNTELMLMDKSLSVKDSKSLRVIYKESERAAKIVSGLLTFAREHRPERRMIKINDIIEESYRLREYNLITNNIDVTLTLSADIPPILADPYQLQQVFTNIIHNARDALMDVGGGALVIRSFYRDDRIGIEFEDGGPGIKQENMKRLFDPFFTTKDVGKGTGMGLSMAYGIVNEHGGTIGVESEFGKGAKFTVELPVITGPDPVAAASETPEIVPASGKSILIVDDEKYIRDLLEQALTERGYKTKTASTVDNAIQLTGKKAFDAIVLDIKMPGMGGKELYAYIKNDNPALAERMLFITGDVLSDDTQVFLKTSAVKYIEKPFKIEAFIRALNDVLGV